MDRMKDEVSRSNKAVDKMRDETVRLRSRVNELRDCDTAVRTQYVLPVTSPVSLLTQTFFTTHSVQYIQYTLSVHLSLL